MKYVGGTKAAIDLLARLEEQGNLISPSPQLLILRVDHYNASVRGELCAIFPPLEKVLNDQLHQPHFLVFNLELKKILCFGLGRKFRLFVINAETHSKVSFYGLNGSGSNKEINEFLKTDPRFQVHKLITGLVRLGQALEDFTALPSIDCDAAEVLTDETSDQDESFFVELDGVRMTRSALKKIVKQYSMNDKHVADAMDEIRFFFPNAEASEFNSEDY
jgi:hypothetical protein